MEESGALLVRCKQGGMNELFELELGCKAKVARRRSPYAGAGCPNTFNANEVAV